MNDLAVDRAARAIATADALLIGAGAGMGVDSGLPDFRGNDGFWRAYPPYQQLGLDFIALTLPGVGATRDANFGNTNGVGFSVNGIRGRNNDQQIDGENNNDNSVTGPAVFMSDPDFVSEYQAPTSNFGAAIRR